MSDIRPARAKVPARGVERISTTARGPRKGIGFAPEMIVDGDHAAYFIQEENSMTTYLISLALVGLIAIAVWEGFA